MQPARERLPRILFVNDFPPDSLAVADLVRQLLLGYPKDKISWWYCRTSRIRGLTDLRVAEIHQFPLPNKVVPNRRFVAIKGAIVERIWIPLAARHLRSTISKVKPDLIWVLLFGWPILVARKANLGMGERLHVSLWDMPDTKDNQACWGGPRSKRFMDAVYWLIRQSSSFDGISEAMLKEIATETARKDGVLIHSGFESEHLTNLTSGVKAENHDMIRLAYVGTVISKSAFLEMISALERLRLRLPKSLKLEFFGARGYRSSSWFNPEWMLEHGVFSDRGLVESLQRCDWGIVVTDPSAEDVRYSRYSFPNKIGTYLSAGVPILAVGHKSSSLAELMTTCAVGVFTTQYQGLPLENFLVETLRIPDPRQRYRETILRCARTEFNANEIRDRLWNTWTQLNKD